MCGDGFALTYSVSDKASFDYIPQIYKQILRVKDRDEYPMILMANKIDLNLQNRRVSRSDGENLGRLYNMPYFEVSAKNRLNIDESFSELIRSIRRFNSSEKMIKYNDERRKICVVL
uniref:Uncharacterized protein n=1 Tax=Romanomermis culicivorax TaxID=13658 RepID=A0A915HWA2_ROMCU